MVQDSGKTPGADAGKPVNTPEPVCMEEKAGLPVAVRARLRQVVMAIEDCWRIDDEWWRDQPISRLYYAVLFTSGHRQVLYKDLTDGHWYRQTY